MQKIWYSAGNILLQEINGTQEELTTANIQYKYQVQLYEPIDNITFTCQGNDNDIMQQTSSSSSGSGSGSGSVK